MTSARLDALDIWDDSSCLRAISPEKVLALVEKLEDERDAVRDDYLRRHKSRIARLKAAVACETDRSEKAEQELRALTDAYDARSKLFHDQEAFYVEQAKRLQEAERLLRQWRIMPMYREPNQYKLTRKLTEEFLATEPKSDGPTIGSGSATGSAPSNSPALSTRREP